VGCGGANGTRDCGCGAAKAADNGERDYDGAPVTVVEWRSSRGGKMQPHERIYEVEEDSRSFCENKKGHWQAGAAAGSPATCVVTSSAGGATWRGGKRPAGLG
jgi:hypothetical protein